MGFLVCVFLFQLFLDLAMLTSIITVTQSASLNMISNSPPPCTYLAQIITK